MSPRLTLFALLAAIVFVAPGCANDCQKLCREMANYWEDCNIAYGDSEVADCRKNFSEKSEDTDTYEASCRQLIRPAENADGERVIGLRARFSCEDMADGPGGAFAGE